MADPWLVERITKTKAIIVAIEDAVLALSGANGVQSYTLDTGQGRQTVTRESVSALQGQLDSLYNRVATLEARATGCGVVTVRPDF
jgi:hypothetical protein